jgi:tRNA (guanine-N7-)-methyltransferase
MTLLYNPPSYFEPLRIGELFPQAQPLEVELGSGDGSFLAQYAEAHRDRNFLGVERLLGRLRKLDRKGQRAGLLNLRGLRIEAGYLLEYMLPPGSVKALHVYFPDPWPKRKHRKNRLISERFPMLAHRALEPGGTVYLRTDDLDYLDQMQSVFGACQEFVATETPADLQGLCTDFEREFQAKGIQIWRVAFQSRTK